MILKEYIKTLQEYQKNNPHLSDTEVVFTQDGYYASGPFADIYEEPELEIKMNKKFIVLGNSSQNY